MNKKGFYNAVNRYEVQEGEERKKIFFNEHDAKKILS